jgi:signal transduction histidine kinase
MRSRARNALILAVLFISVSGTASAQEPTTLTSEEEAWLAAHGPIRYAPDPSYPPFESVDEQGVTSGINVDLLNRMSRNLDFNYETVVLDDWTAVLEAMQAGEVDLLGSLARTPERETYMDFIGPYMQVGEVFYVRTDNPTESVDDLGQQTVGYIPSYAGGQWLVENYPDLNFVAVEDTRDGLHKVSTAEIDSFFENIPVAAYIIRTDALSNIRIMGEPLKFSESNWGVTKNHTILYSIIEKGMASIPPGEQTKVFEYWSGYDLGVVQTPRGLTTFWRSALISLGIATVGVGGWSISLRRTVRRRTRDLEESRNEVMGLNEDLEARILARTTALEDANETLQAFSTTVSHDLKTPLTSISVFNATIGIRFKDELGDDGLALLGRVERSVRRMSALIDNVLRLSQTSQSTLDRQDINVSNVANEILASLQDSDPDRRVGVVVEPNIQLRADPTLLRIILSNLIGNAWKYTREAETPKIHVNVEHADGTTICSVSDNGIGLPEGEGANLFTSFFRAPGLERFEGTGLGLATVLRGVKRHNGHVWANNNAEHGATFYFHLGPDEK